MGHQEDIVKTESKIIVIRDTQVSLTEMLLNCME